MDTLSETDQVGSTVEEQSSEQGSVVDAEHGEQSDRNESVSPDNTGNGNYSAPVPLPPRKPKLLAHVTRSVLAIVLFLVAIIIAVLFLEPILLSVGTTYSLPEYLQVAGFFSSTEDIDVPVIAKRLVPGPAARQTCVVLEADLSEFDLPNRPFLECWGGEVQCPPTRSPTTAPTTSPSAAPTAPTTSPTGYPTPAPTQVSRRRLLHDGFEDDEYDDRVAMILDEIDFRTSGSIRSLQEPENDNLIADVTTISSLDTGEDLARISAINADRFYAQTSIALREEHYIETTEFGYHDFSIQQSNLAQIDNTRKVVFRCNDFLLNDLDFEVEVGSLAKNLSVPYVGFPGVGNRIVTSEFESCVVMTSSLVACGTTEEIRRDFTVLNFGNDSQGNRNSVVQVALGTYYGCALVSEFTDKQELAVYCWGDLFEPDSGIDLGEPGEYAEIPGLRLSEATSNGNVTLVTTRNFACVFASTIECVGDAPNFGTRFESGLYECGYVPGGGSKVTFGNYHVCITTGTSTKCFGVNRFGVLGGSSLSESIKYTNPNGDSLSVGVAELVDISSHYRHNCAVFQSLEASSDVKSWVQCWGSNAQNQLGVEVARTSEGDSFSIVPVTVPTTQTIKLCAILPGCTSYAPEFNEFAQQVQLGVVATAICILIVTLYWFTFQPYLRRRSAYKQYWKSRTVTKFVEDEESEQQQIVDEDDATTGLDKIEYREGAAASAERNGVVVESSGSLDKLDDNDVAEVFSS